MPEFSSRTTLIENARVYTMDRAAPGAQALAWREGRIVAVGTRDEVARAAGPQARRIDLGDRALIPGLIDSHIHFLSYSRGLAKIDLDGVKSKEEARARVAERARQVGRLYRALDRLPEAYRTVLILCDIDGQPAGDVARLLGLKPNAIWVRVHRGRAKLLAELSREQPGGAR